MVALRTVEAQLLPVELAYWTDQLDIATGALVGLKSSIKSLRQGAPVAPPAPYSWLITRWDPPGAGVLVGVGEGVGVLVAPGMGVEALVGVVFRVRVLGGGGFFGGVPGGPPPAIHSVPL